MKKIFIILVVFSFIGTCRSGEEVLAEFKGGVIKRKEFREFYPNHEIAIDNNSTSLKYQSSILETMAVQSIIEIEMMKKGYTNSDIYKSILDLKEKQLLVNLYRKNYTDKALKSKELEMVFGQMLYIKKDANGNPNTVRADHVLNDLKNLKSDKEINAYISKETDEDGRKPIAGYLEPQCMNCSEDNILRDILIDAYKSNSLQTFTKKEFHGDTFVYRIIEVKKMNADNLESYLVKKFKDFKKLALEFKATAPENQKQFADYFAGEEGKVEKDANMFMQRFKEQMQTQIWNEEYERVSKGSGFEISKEMSTMEEKDLTDSTPIYSKGNKVYTFVDLKKDYAKVNMKPNSYTPQTKELIYFLNSAILPIAMFEDNLEIKTLKSSEKFISNLTTWKKNICWSFFIRDLQDTQTPATEQELKDTYEAGKLYAYSTPSKTDPNKREPIPFAQVKDKIIEELRTSKIKSDMQKQVEKLKTDYNLKLYSEKLKAGTV